MTSGWELSTKYLQAGEQESVHGPPPPPEDSTTALPRWARTSSFLILYLAHFLPPHDPLPDLSSEQLPYGTGCTVLKAGPAWGVQQEGDWLGTAAAVGNMVTTE